MGKIQDELMADDKLVERLRIRFDRFQKWCLSANTLPNDMFGVTYEPHALRGDADYPKESISVIFVLADGVLTRWEWMKNYYTPKDRRNFQRQAAKLRKIADSLHGTPYADQALKIAGYLELEIDHALMPDGEAPMVGRERNLKTYAIRCVYKAICDHLPIRSLHRGDEESPWQTSPNIEIAMIVTHLTGEETTAENVVAALNSTRRKYYT